jgi:hypothetical protein
VRLIDLFKQRAIAHSSQEENDASTSETTGSHWSALLELRQQPLLGDLHPWRAQRQDHPPPRLSQVRHTHHHLGADHRRVMLDGILPRPR